MKIVITGGAGFIGSNLVKQLAKNKKNTIVIIDNLSSGKKEFIKNELKQSNVFFEKKDLLKDDLNSIFKGAQQIWHLAANPDVKSSTTDIDNVFAQNVNATKMVLEQAKKHKIKDFIFSSTSTIYGSAKIIPTKEDYGPLVPVSIYGATKLSSEALICAYASLFSFRAYIFRFANVIGKNSTHGVIFDFVNKLKKNPKTLQILGNGKQTKSYICVSDCIDGMLFAMKKSKENVNTFNIGTKEATSTLDIADIVAKVMSVSPEYKCEKCRRGWAGDVTKMILDVSKLEKLGWSARYSSAEAIKLTAKYLFNHVSKTNPVN
ncbi:MAG: NAD-dependent epimerase/dehydratase family protein [Candidatus Aenigmarchaeota archaeon]|nr:NAD-dependent epimerase/dehydratase family protein [Candidatus Aenigmarchaeota archaeon]